MWYQTASRRNKRSNRAHMALGSVSALYGPKTQSIPSPMIHQYLQILKQRTESHNIPTILIWSIRFKQKVLYLTKSAQWPSVGLNQHGLLILYQINKVALMPTSYLKDTSIVFNKGNWSSCIYMHRNIILNTTFGNLTFFNYNNQYTQISCFWEI